MLDYSDNYNNESNSKDLLIKYSKSDNIAELLSNEELQEIVNKLIAGINEDENSQQEWMTKVDDVQRLMKCSRDPKNYPLPNSANIKYPLIQDACNHFASRTYPELVHDGKAVKFELVGLDTSGVLAQIAEIGSNYLNYKLLGPDNEWETSLDKLVNIYPINGFVLKKTYYDPFRQKICSDVCNYKDIIVQNSCEIQCLQDLRRITHKLYYNYNTLIEGCRKGLYLEESCNNIVAYYSEMQVPPRCKLLECHCFLDLDEDGYEEPYIVTLHKETYKVLRIVARYKKEDIQTLNNKISCIYPRDYFTDFHFLPSPDGNFLSIGYGFLLLHVNETVNSIFNQLVDAGSLANMQTGIIDSRIKIMGGQIGVDPGQWTKAKGVVGQSLKEGLYPIQYKEPSTVLYQLLGMLIQAAQDLTSSTDVMQGTANATNVPATSMLAMVEQGIKRFSAIQKRLYRSLKEEYHKIFALYREYVDPKEFAELSGDPTITPEMIFGNDNIRVFPIADPNLATDAQRLSQAQVIMSLVQQPGINKAECYKRLLTAAKVPHPELIAPPEMAQQAQAPDPRLLEAHADMINKQQETMIKARHQDLKEKEFAAKLAKMEAEITNLQSQAVKNVSQAHADQRQVDISDHMSKLETIKTQLQHMTEAHQQLVDSNIANKEIALKQQQIQNQHQQVMTGHAITHIDNAQQNDLQQQQINNNNPQEGTNNGADNSGSDNNVEQSSNN